ncbi:PAS/PAC sensor signal transduction histidine kinase [Thiorhodococcus drewsii AZ1]|uniref:histidine kinase n=1 Tax=Thiorhodococcus drewsii AZ1 TaxID=765913 RepID=G2E2E7_9GAMM|nr:PAS domain-containing sensor histidine kinase [Thiorhodococcus drewsii]EGV30863.1 PAS/PAC sensor signal transduction histidine kinase [Thiorhodococcus drewsii AZ1]
MSDKGAGSGSSERSSEGFGLDELQRLDRGSLEAQFDALVSALGAAREAHDAQRCMMLDLQSHQIELEIQGRELRETQKALELSRNHYARLFEEAPVGYVVFDREGRIRAVNLAASCLIGRPASELEGASLLDFVVDSEPLDLLAHLGEVFDASDGLGESCDLTLHFADSDGVRVVRLCSVRREAVSGPECMAVLLDITAEHRVEAERQANERLRQAVLDALPSQIAVLDRAGNIIAANRAWREFAEESGVSEDLRNAVRSDHLIACCSGEADRIRGEGESSSGILQVLNRERTAFSAEYPCHTAQCKRWFVMRAVALEGEQEGAVVSYVDVTERRLAEEDARRARDALAQVARLNAVGILASSLIHELLQPLSSASFFCSAASQLAEGPAADPARLVDVIGRVSGQIQRAGDIMERLRVFLRGRKMHKVTASLDQVVRGAFALVQWFASDRKVLLRLAVPDELPELLIDPVQIEQILVNLICNAVQAIDAIDPPRREVSIEVVPGDTEILMVVRDSGPGLPNGRHETVFDIFESTNDSSLGLGLAISRSIAEAHGGRLWADPGNAEGAVFCLTLPLPEADPTAVGQERLDQGVGGLDA